MPELIIAEQLARLRRQRTAPLILELDLTEGIAEEPPSDPISAVVAMRRPRMAEVLDSLRRAKADPRVRGLIAKVGGRRIGFARVQELRAAIEDFAASGKS